jgi:HEAT repeat protein
LFKPTELHPRLEALQHIDFSKNQLPWGKLLHELQLEYKEYISKHPIQQAKNSLNASDPIERKNGIETLVDMNAVEDLADAVEHSIRTVSIDASFALSTLTGFQDKRAVLGLWKALEDTDWTLRKDAATALGKLKDHSSVQKLISALKDSVGDVRYVAAEALGEIGDETAIPALIESLTNGYFLQVQHISAIALAKIGIPSIPKLLEVLQGRNNNIHARIGAADALGDIGDASAVPELVKTVDDKNSDLQIHSIRALGKIKDPTTISKLLEILCDPNSDLGEEAATALGRMGDIAIHALLIALKAQNGRSRKLALEALGEIRSIETIDAIIEMLADKYPEVKNAAVLTLGKIGTPCVTKLIDALNNKEFKGRPYIIATLGWIGDEKALPNLLKVLDDESDNAEICAATVRALGGIAHAKAVPSIIKHLSDTRTVTFQIGFGFVSEQLISEIAKECLNRIGTPEALTAVRNWQNTQKNT